MLIFVNESENELCFKREIMKSTMVEILKTCFVGYSEAMTTTTRDELER